MERTKKMSTPTKQPYLPQAIKAAFVPGFLGSALTDSAGKEIWSDNHIKNIKLLADNPSILKWNQIRAEAQIIDNIRIAEHLPFYKYTILGKLRKYFSSHPHFGRKDGVIYCPYDWRQSIADSAMTVASLIERSCSSPMNTPLGTGEPKLAVFTHSMGALVVRIAITQELIHPSRIDRIIHIGAPLRGAPSAFQIIYGQSRLPLLRSMLYYRNFLTPQSKRLFIESLSSFPSLWELLPHCDIDYLVYSELTRCNPLTREILEASITQGVRDIHDLSNSAIGIIASHSIPVYTIYSTGLGTEKEFVVEALAHPRGYRILGIRNDQSGDGTVPVYSAEGDGTCRRCPVSGVKHASMCDSDKVVSMLPTMFSAARGGEMISFFGFGKSRIIIGTPLTAVVVTETVLSNIKQLSRRSDPAPEVTVEMSSESMTLLTELPHRARYNIRTDFYVDVYVGDVNTVGLEAGAYQCVALSGSEAENIDESIWVLDFDQLSALIKEELSIPSEYVVFSNDNFISDLIDDSLERVFGDLVHADGTPAPVPVCKLDLSHAKPFHLKSTNIACMVIALAWECRQFAVSGAQQEWTFRANAEGLTLLASLALERPLTSEMAQSLKDQRANEILLLQEIMGEKREDIVIHAEPGEDIVSISIKLAAFKAGTANL